MVPNLIITFSPSIIVRPTSQWAIPSSIVFLGRISALRALFKQGGDQALPIRNKVLSPSLPCRGILH